MSGVPSWHDDLASLREYIRNYHDSGCFVYLPSGACDCGIAPPVETLLALARVEAELSRLREQRDAARSALRWIVFEAKDLFNAQEMARSLLPKPEEKA